MANEECSKRRFAGIKRTRSILSGNRDYCYKHRPDGDEPRECQCNVFWYDTEDLENRYKQEEAKVGDLFYDGNNGDKHLVAAVDLENSRLAYSNLDQCEELLHIACW